MHIISLLSGISLGDEEAIVRASAVRALAIFVLFPSLKEGNSSEWHRQMTHFNHSISKIKIADICYIENTAEAIIQLMQDECLPVRIKASWALANITDVLVVNM